MKDKKKIKEKPKGPICPILSQMFHVRALQFQGESYTFPGDPRQPQYESRTATWHCEREKCALWIQETLTQEIIEVPDLPDETASPMLRVGVPLPPVELIPTGKGWCGKIVPPRGPAK